MTGAVADYVSRLRLHSGGATLLPNASIVHCERERMDTCLSIYRQLFVSPDLRYAFDMQEIGQVYFRCTAA